MVNRVTKKIRNYYRRFQPLTLGYNHVIWVIGDGRSGTTWLANLINHDRRYRFLFEPLHRNVFDFLKDDQPYPYPMGDNKNRLRYAYDQIFTGKIHHGWVDKFSNDSLWHKGLIVKDVYAHFCASWVNTNYPNVKKVLIVRNPFAVAASKLLTGWRWFHEPSVFLDNQVLTDKFLGEHVGLIQKAQDPVVRYVLIWAILHNVLFKQLKVANIGVFFFEDLCLNYEFEINRLLSYLNEGQKVAKNSLLMEAQWTLSPVSRNVNDAYNKKEIVGKWRNTVSPEQIRQGNEVLSDFGLSELYSGNHIMPNKNAKCIYQNLT